MEKIDQSIKFAQADNCNYGKIICCGDLNMKDINWDHLKYE